MNDAPLRIVYAADNDYAMPLAAAVRSLLDSCDAGTSIDLVVLSSGITESNRRKLSQSWESDRLQSLAFVDIDKRSFDVLPGQSPSNEDVMRSIYGSFEVLPGQSPSNEDVMRAVYARLTIPAAVPKDWDRVLYLDADTVVRGDLTELFFWELKGEAVAARRDPIITELGHPGGVQSYEDIGAHPRAPYFNAGVMVLDLDLWRRRDLAGEVLSFVYTHGDKMNLRDQEGLNAVLQGKFAPFPWKWNTITLIGRDKVPRPTGEDVPECSKVLHYVGSLKPWMAGGSQVPGAEYFFDSLERTVWRGQLGLGE